MVDSRPYTEGIGAALRKTLAFGLPTRLNTNSTAIEINEDQGFYYLYSENKGTGQLRGYHQGNFSV